ncbi:MAG: hypothetical protein QOF23_1628, partial [Solirubrobacterales bacterium]|nr:hypothetical protein [Solirubrobacterales bacterium]
TVLGVPTAGPGSLQREGERVLVRVRFDRGAISRLPALSDAGGLVQTASRRYQTATVSALPSQLRVLAEVPGVVAVSAGRTPLLLQASTSVAGEPPCEGGAVITEGLKQLRVDLARETFGLRGKGITVGVLSDSFNRATKAVTGGPIATHAKEDIISGDLPGPAGSCSGQQAPVVVLEEGPASGSTDEGRAMLQIVHDVAPNAGLAFASAFKSEEAFAKNIERLALPVSAGGAGAKVIVDDVAYFEEPFFQDGPVAAAVNKVTAEGITYLTAAGNDNLFDASGNEIASWEAPEFRDAGSCPAAVGVAATHCMDFNPGAGSDTGFGITVEPGGTLIADLQWAEPWNGVKTDLDAYLLNKTGTEVLAKATENNIAAQKPVELIGWENKSPSSREVQLVINRCSGGCNPQASATAKPRLKFALLENGGGVEETEYAVSAGGDVVGPTIFGHAGAAAALSVGAIRYSTTSAPEEYSSRGPVTHYFGPVAGAEAAAPLGAPEPIEKPDFVATDCGATTFFARFQEGAWRFCGTSAAAPHAAGIAALLAEGKPGATPPEIRSALDASAVPVGSYPPEAIGAGLLQADGALTQLGVSPGSEDGPSTIVPPLESEPGTAVVQPPVPTPTPSAPTTRFTKHPAKTVRTRGRTARVVFRFGSDQPGVTFLCKIDGAAFRVCPAKLVRRFALGRHTLRVKARNAAGRTDATPAVFRFRVERIA